MGFNLPTALQRQVWLPVGSERVGALLRFAPRVRDGAVTRTSPSAIGPDPFPFLLPLGWGRPGERV